MKKTLLKGCNVLITLAMLFSLWPVAVPAQPPLPKGTPPVKTAADKAMTKIEPGLRALGLGEVVVLDETGTMIALR